MSTSKELSRLDAEYASLDSSLQNLAHHYFLDESLWRAKQRRFYVRVVLTKLLFGFVFWTAFTMPFTVACGAVVGILMWFAWHIQQFRHLRDSFSSHVSAYEQEAETYLDAQRHVLEQRDKLCQHQGLLSLDQTVPNGSGALSKVIEPPNL